jgi:hypothetical protein
MVYASSGEFDMELWRAAAEGKADVVRLLRERGSGRWPTT